MHEDAMLRRGRASLRIPPTRAQELINRLILSKVLQERGHNEAFSSTQFDSILTFTYFSEVDYHREIGIRHRLTLSSVTEASLPDAAVSLFNMKSTDAKSQESTKGFFASLNQGFIGKSKDGDAFFTTLAESPGGLLAFPAYADLMTDMQIPRVKSETLKPSSEERSYLEAFGQAIDIEGEKAKIFKRFDQKVTNLLGSNAPVDKRLETLRTLLPEASLFRDGFIDKWERSLVPEVSVFGSSLIQGYLSKQQKKGQHDAYDSFAMLTLMTPLQWEKSGSLATPPDWQMLTD